MADPKTDCPLCARAEETRLDKLLRLVLGPRVSPIAAMGQSYASMLRALLGEAPWYERHREGYARTGNERELTRMLRHVDR